MITAVDPSVRTGASSFDAKPKLPAGNHILRCVRLLTSRKDGSYYVDNDGDRKCFAIFESDSRPNHDGISQAVYDSRHSITTNRDEKLGKTASFVGKFIHSAGIPQITQLDEMLELTAHAEVVHKGEWVNIKRWFRPPTTSDGSKDQNDKASSSSGEEDKSKFIEDDVPF